VSDRPDRTTVATELAATAPTAAASATATAAGAAAAATAGPRLLAGSPIAAEIRAGLVTDFAAFKERWGYVPTLAIVLVGADAPSAVYLQQILRTCEKVGVQGRLVEIGSDATADALCNEIERLNADPAVAGNIVRPVSRSGPSSTRSTRPRTSTASTPATPACSRSATTASCRRRPRPRSRS
jgi:methylenetetrahydrofolate dehydrogenase (NADP+)/methenyltetrahydrofolate cyclohydrolase